jgi:hypothetical protein
MSVHPNDRALQILEFVLYNHRRELICLFHPYAGAVVPF